MCSSVIYNVGSRMRIHISATRGWARRQCVYSGKAAASAGRSLAELSPGERGERGEVGEGKYSRAAGTASSLAHRANCC